MQSLWKQTDFDVTVGQCLLCDDNSALRFLSDAVYTVSDGDVKVGLSAEWIGSLK